jgi:hypothetical protein
MTLAGWCSCCGSLVVVVLASFVLLSCASLGVWVLSFGLAPVLCLGPFVLVCSPGAFVLDCHWVCYLLFMQMQLCKLLGVAIMQIRIKTFV